MSNPSRKFDVPTDLTTEQLIGWKSLMLSYLIPSWVIGDTDENYETFITIDNQPQLLNPYADTIDGRAQCMTLVLAVPQFMFMLTSEHLASQDDDTDILAVATQQNILDTILNIAVVRSLRVD